MKFFAVIKNEKLDSFLFSSEQPQMESDNYHLIELESQDILVSDYYYCKESKKICRKNKMPIIVDGLKIINIPSGTKFNFQYESGLVNDGEITVSKNYNESVSVSLFNDAYFDEVVYL